MGQHDKTHRIIFKLTGTTRPRDRRKRTVDLRVGDSFVFKGRLLSVVRIDAQVDRLLTAAADTVSGIA